MTSRNYILNDKGVPVLAKFAECVEFFGSDQMRIVKQEHIGKFLISTVFLCLDHGCGKGPPVLWETMVFHPNPNPKPAWPGAHVFKQVELDGFTERCSGTREQAEAMHERVVRLVKKLK